MPETPSSTPSPPPGLAAATVAIAFLAGAILLFELVLVRLFSFLTWHHYAFVVISIALLGFAASGVALQVWPDLGRPPRRRAALYGALFGVTSVAAVAVIGRFRLNLGSSGIEAPGEILGLLASYLVLLVPFLFAGLAVVTLLGGFTRHAGRLYGSDLLGAGAGCAAFVAVTPWLGAEGTVFAAAAVACLAAAILAGREAPRTTALWGAAALALAAGAAAPGWLAVRPGPGKTLEQLLRDPGVEPVFTRWSALFRTDVVADSPPVSWTRNAFFDVPQPDQHLIVIDGDAGTPILHLDDVSDLASPRLRSLDYMLSGLPHQALAPGRVLVIGAGGGIDVLTALRFGAKEVDAVEVNRDVVHLGREVYADLNGGLFRRGDVTLHLDEGRSFIRRGDRRYDLIQLSLVDTWAASASGAYSLVEGYLYTVEAFRDYLTHLTPDGALAVSRWLSTPPRETLRLVTVARAALEELGSTEPGRHVVVAANGRIGTVLVKATPFSSDELAALRAVAGARRFSVLHPPPPEPDAGGPAADGGAPADALRRSFESWQTSLRSVLAARHLGLGGDESLFTSFLAAPTPEAFFRVYPLDVTPVRDERPFFFEFGAATAGHGQLSGRGLILAVTAQALVLSLVLLVLPLTRGAGKRTPWSEARGSVAYFLFIGVAFMLLEVSLIQRFTLYLGHPIYGLSLVLLVLLVGAGLGSLASGRLAAGPLFAGITGLAVLYAVALPAFFQATLALPFAARVTAGVVLLLPLGFLLGMPFPTALARLAGERAPLVGWAWAANGCGSVLGPLVAMLLAMEQGYGFVLLVAAALYGAAFLVLRRDLDLRPAARSLP